VITLDQLRADVESGAIDTVVVDEVVTCYERERMFERG
jgi:hypothetical protein